MSLAPNPWSRPAGLLLAAGAVLIAALAGCGKQDDVAQPGATSSGGIAAKPATDAVSSQVAALSADALRDKAAKAYQDSRLYAPAGDNAMEYYLALRDKSPGDPGASSALTDLMPMTVIATEQSRDREDFVEAQRLYGLLEKADKSHPALPRLKASIAAAQDALAKRNELQKLTAEQELARKEQLEKERLQQQQAQQAAAAQPQPLPQAEQTTAAQREPERAAAAPKEPDQGSAATRAAQQRNAPAAAASTAAPRAATSSRPADAAPAETAASSPAPTAAVAKVSDLRAISTAQPRYPPEALRSGQAGEVQIEFTVGTDGSVSNARVVRASPPRVFDREAIAAVRRWRFEPVDAPVTTRRTIGFNPGK